jgi:nucleoside-triphosphatase THEP1
METLVNKPPDSTWLKAAVVGSIWASIEIILGSFLHNLRIPVSGMVLSIISVYLLVAVMQVWKEPGIIWRAGIICALMKSISPSAIILGPMTGILAEAFLIELFVFVFGRNLLGYMVSGALAVLSTILHKLVSLLIIYGFDLIKILEALYQFALKQLRIEELSPVFLIALISAIYILSGMTAAIGGYFAGRRYNQRQRQVGTPGRISLGQHNNLFNFTTGQKYSVPLLFINLIAMAAILFFMNSKQILVPALLSAVYVGFCIYHYRSSLNRLKKPIFWLSFAAITLTTAFLWNGISKGTFFSMDGLLVGIRMNVRAVIMVLGFAAVSIELKNPLVKTVLFSGGMASLYQSLSLAFAALPYLISVFSTATSKRRWRRIRFQDLFDPAEALYQAFQTEHLYKPPVVIITGEVHQGKTTFTREIVNNLLEKNTKIAGFLAIGINTDTKRTGFILHDIESAEQIPLCSKRFDETSLSFGRYYFNPEALLKGAEILSDKNLSDKQLIVIDEIGPLELSGQGWSNAIENCTKKYPIPQLWVVRKSVVKKISRKWNVGNIFIFDISHDTIADATAKTDQLISGMPDHPGDARH